MSSVPKLIGPAGKVFRDPVHGLIRIEAGDDFVRDLINTPEFQRLRRVRQLGLSSFTYPGAEHTRFAHCIGVFNFAQRILDVLKRRYAAWSAVQDVLIEQQRTVKAAALLHDVGHGPFSHMIERAFRAVADHEKKTVALIQDGGAITDCLVHHKLDPKAVANLVRKASEYRFLVDVVSSQLDADRMDYVLRDALSTGVKYGAYDSEWVLNSLCLGGEPSLSEAPELRDLRLCLEEKRGLFSAEQLVMARTHMSYQVYYHKATRGWEAHLLCLLKLAAEAANSGTLPPTTPANVGRFLRDGSVLQGDDWLWFDESAIEASMHAWAMAGQSHAELKELSRAFLLREKVFLCAELGSWTTEQALRLSMGLGRAGRDGIDWLLDDPKFTSYKDFDSGFRGGKQIQDPAAVSTSAILISDGRLESTARPAESVSLVLDALGERPAGNRTSLARLFYHRKVAEPVEKALAEVGLAGA